MLRTEFNSELRIEHYENAMDCYDLIKKYSELYWKDKSNQSKSNYDFESNEQNSIKYLLETNKLNLGYSIVYENNEPMAFGGIRSYDGYTIIAARAFCFWTPKLLLNKILVPYHLSYCKNIGVKRAILSFNEYNHKIYRLWPKLNLEKDIVDCSFFSADFKQFNLLGKQTVNGMDQYTIEWLL